MTLATREQDKGRVSEERKKLRAQYSNYENAVTLISSIENWFHHRWGSGDANSLKDFDRFPDYDGLKPDFHVAFTTPYLLCGEVTKTFRPPDQGGHKDVEQLVRFSQWRPTPEPVSRSSALDVVLLVSTESDDVAAAAVLRARQSSDPSEHPGAPIVILGYRRDRERIDREDYIVKWRPHEGNSRFSEPNVSSDPSVEGLNELLTKTTHHPIPVDQEALDVTRKNPFINDDPPPLYTLVRVVWPALNELLTDTERDQLRLEGRVEKRVSFSQLMSASIVQAVSERQAYLRRALAFLVECDSASQVQKGQDPEYLVKFDLTELHAELDYFADKRARRIVRGAKRKTTRHKGAKRQRAKAPEQPKLF